MVVRRRQSRGSDAGVYGHKAKVKDAHAAWTGRLTGVLIFVAFALAFAIVSFWGNNWSAIQFVPGNMAKTRIVAEIPFEYESSVRTERLYEQKKDQTSNVFSIDERSYDSFIRALKLLDEQMENFTYEHTLAESGREDIREFVNEFVALNVIKLEWQDVALLVGTLSTVERTKVFQECISILREIARDGVFSESLHVNVEPGRAADYLGLKLKDGNRRNIRTVELAMRYVRMHLMSMDIDQDIVGILFNILKQGIKPNLVYDVEESKAKFDVILKSIKPVRVKVKKWDIILERNVEIDKEAYEALDAYKKALRVADRLGCGFHMSFYPKTLFGAIALYMVVFAMQLVPKNRRPKMKDLISLGTLAIVQLLLLRAFVQIGDCETFSNNFALICSLHLIPPMLCAAGIAMLIYGTTGGVIVSYLVSVYYTLMISKTMDFLMEAIVAHLVFLNFLKNVNFRIKIVRAGVFSGMIIPVVLLAKHLLPITIDKLAITQSCASMVMCMSSGVAVVMLLPVFERVFSLYSNVALLELTDYNNPILKNLQVSAPGTYNHSLIVSNIAEQVAIHVNANSILCKTGALYHDIGKMLKSEYFIENQNNQANLHDQQTPYISTLVIKNHIRDGVELAREYKLPPSIVDVIQQHHGTTLIQYFYEKAKRDFLANADTTGMSSDEIANLIANKINASVFRYDGPRPRTKENLIIMLSDSIEAASRSMKRVTHQAIESLVTMIFDVKLNDHQFDECPVTFNEIREL
ncbi:MAG: HDIG domain-containing protein, partial [Puniceicoccales bacterium]|nr:HDIG domain-containing protein [Puniceicoccales bacterium]